MVVSAHRVPLNALLDNMCGSARSLGARYRQLGAPTTRTSQSEEGHFCARSSPAPRVLARFEEYAESFDITHEGVASIATMSPHHLTNGVSDHQREFCAQLTVVDAKLRPVVLL